MANEGHRSCACTCAIVEHSLSWPQALKSAFHQMLGFGAGDQHMRIHLKLEAVILLDASAVLPRDPVGARARNFMQL